METIGPYKVVSTLKGGRRPMFVVTAKDGSTLALKTVPLADLNPEERERFEREASVCSTLDHPNLVRVVDSGNTADALYQAMPYLEGADFTKVFGSGRQFSWDEKLSMMEGVCDGLAYAHGRKLVHRDIKPANLFLENNGNVRILDFGMVRLDSSVLTRAGAAIGTLNYMAPEQIRGEPCTPASDVFATAIVFHELCTGSHPFAGRKKSLPEILSAILFDAPPAWEATGAPEGLEFVIRRALEKDAAKRWPSAAELRQAIALCRFTMENRPGAAAVVAAAVPVPAASDSQKTVVMKREAGPRPVASAPVEASVSPVTRAPEPPPAPPRTDVRFCPACARPNAAGTVICVHCGGPLSAIVNDGSAGSALRFKAVWIAAGIVAVLAILAVIVLR